MNSRVIREALNRLPQCIFAAHPEHLLARPVVPHMDHVAEVGGMHTLCHTWHLQALTLAFVSLDTFFCMLGSNAQV
jgi:hypothetical protein